MSGRPAARPELRDYLRRHFDGEVSEVTAGATGSSNDTSFFTVTPADGPPRQYVLRNQTAGHQLFLDIDVLFQARVMRALAGEPGLPVPAVVLEEPDDSLIGSPFYVMERVPGDALSVAHSFHADGWLAQDTPERQARTWRNTVAMIARVGRVDWRARLPFLDTDDGRGEPGLDRYLCWVEDWFAWAAAGRPQPVADLGLAYLREHQPADPPVELVWGDATMANLMWSQERTVNAVLDWEMATLGPGELDLGWLLFMSDMYSDGMGVPKLAGLPNQRETLGVFAEHAGRAARDIEYYMMVSAVRMAIVAMRFTDLQIGYGSLPADTTYGVSNPATHVLADLLGVPRPAPAGVTEAARRASARGERGHG